jgi:pyruvate dehydrogenase E1 component
MPEMPAGCEEGIIKGLYQINSVDAGGKQHVQLLGSGPILRETLRAQQILAEKYHVSSDVWSATSYTQLRREAQECEHFNRLHPDQPQRVPYVQQLLADTPGPIVAASDYMAILAEQISPWLAGRLYALGTDGMGRSESRQALRRHFEVDGECIAAAALYRLAAAGQCDAACAARAIRELDIDPEKRFALYA